MAKRPPPGKRERLHDILGRYGDGRITKEMFETLMKAYRLTDADIDAYCRDELE